jgi:uncharacterized protein (TIGR02118 family)
MLKMMILIKRKEGMSPAEFLDYYENRHVPLVESLLPPLPYYRRNYVSQDHPMNMLLGKKLDFDVVTEIEFDSAEDAKHWFSVWTAPTIAGPIDRDEANFVSETYLFVVDERNSVHKKK